MALATRNFAINWNTKKRVFRQFSLRFRKRFKRTLYLEGLPCARSSCTTETFREEQCNQHARTFCPGFFFFLHENKFFLNCRPKLQAMFTTFSQLNFLEEISIVKRTFTILLNFLGLYCAGAHFSKVPVNRCVCRYSLQNNL